MIEYLEKLTSFYSITDDQKSVKHLLDYVQSFFESYDLHTEFYSYNGVHNLYVSSRPTKRSHILLQAHVDVVPGRQPFRIQEDTVYGRGVFDDLFATAAYMQLVDDLQYKISELDFAIMLSGDEEKGGFNGAKKLLDSGVDADICILPDAGEGFGSLNIAAKGVYQVTVRIKGIAHHASRPWEGDNATQKLVHFLKQLERQFDNTKHDHSTLTISTLHAGEAINQGPGTAEVGLDIRYINKHDLVRIKNVFHDLLVEYDGEIIQENTGLDYRLDTKNAFVKRFIHLYEKQNGGEIRLTKAHGSSDARFFSEKNIPVIMFRPDGGGAHGDNEWLSIASYAKFYKLLHAYITSEAPTKV